MVSKLNEKTTKEAILAYSFRAKRGFEAFDVDFSLILILFSYFHMMLIIYKYNDKNTWDKTNQIIRLIENVQLPQMLFSTPTKFELPIKMSPITLYYYYVNFPILWTPSVSSFKCMLNSIHYRIFFFFK